MVNNTDNFSIASPWAWTVPMVSVTGLIIVWLSGSNESLFVILNSLGKSETGALLWANITIMGDALLAFALLSLFVRHRPEIVWAVIISAIFAVFWVHGLKFFIGHPRPPAVLSADVINIIGVHLRGGSFPSGHSTTAFVLAGVICNLHIHKLLSWIVLILATLTGISRAVVGAHWPMDIFAGAFGGWIIAVISIILFRQLAKRKHWEEQLPGQLVFNAGLLIIAISLFFYDSGYPASRPFQYTIATIAILVIGYNFSQMFRRASMSNNESQ
jgi:membrane-associated phospholipid phosphatase